MFPQINYNENSSINYIYNIDGFIKQAYDSFIPYKAIDKYKLSDYVKLLKEVIKSVQENKYHTLKCFGINPGHFACKTIMNEITCITPKQNSNNNLILTNILSIKDDVDDSIVNSITQLLKESSSQNGPGYIKNIHSNLIIDKLEIIDIKVFTTMFCCSTILQHLKDKPSCSTENAFASIILSIDQFKEGKFNFPIWVKYKGKPIIIDLVSGNTNKNPQWYDEAYVIALTAVGTKGMI